MGSIYTDINCYDVCNIYLYIRNNEITMSKEFEEIKFDPKII